ncbi:MAG: glyoxalase [Flavobacterium sp.]|uniref:glyoxalase n=1 Tax=Flavobacterium sp. TaxID=239 RepID=UPI00120CEF51|nr:glyoxalase [Flavobacterium sp.]RZJ64404.1 MAG: glyoxalase [Flavobacterium sp.]
MEHKFLSLRPFIGSKDFSVSRNFYKDLGFFEVVLSPGLSLFQSGKFAFYLQDAYVKDWIDNTMIFMEVEDTAAFYEQLAQLDLPSKYEGVRIVPIRQEEWGRECFVHDPSGILWHFGKFLSK